MLTTLNNLLLYLLLIFIIFSENSCTHMPFYLSEASKLTNKKINNLIDINGDGKSDLVFWNFYNAQDDKHQGNCFFETVNFPNVNYQLNVLGNVGDIPVYGDFTGDGTFDYGIYRNSDAGNIWYLIDGLTKESSGNRYGEVGDLPVPSDYDGDGKFDFVVYRPKNSGFYGNLSDKNKLLEIHFGITGDIPVPKDYDGDSSADLAVYRIVSGEWAVRASQNGLTKYFVLGGPDYFPVPADYDGDGKCDFAVWNYKNNDCKIIFSFLHQQLSGKTSLKIKEKLQNIKCYPVSSDFDGDGKSELAFWEYEKKLLHIFKVRSNNLEYAQYNINSIKNSEPINDFLLKRFFKQNHEINLPALYKEYKSGFSGGQKEVHGDCDGDFVDDLITYNPPANSFTINLSSSNGKKPITFDLKGQPLAGDFDGDGKYDVGVLSENKIFTYFSSALSKFNYITLDDKINGLPFAYDVDLDSMFDLVFYNPSTNIFGFTQSSNSYMYDEVSFKKKGSGIMDSEQ